MSCQCTTTIFEKVWCTVDTREHRTGTPFTHQAGGCYTTTPIVKRSSLFSQFGIRISTLREMKRISRVHVLTCRSTKLQGFTPLFSKRQACKSAFHTPEGQEESSLKQHDCAFKTPSQAGHSSGSCLVLRVKLGYSADRKHPPDCWTPTPAPMCALPI